MQTMQTLRVGADEQWRRVAARPWLAALLATVIASVSGCATAPAPTASQDQQTVARALATQAAHHQVRDLRGDYMQALCALLPADKRCTDVLLPLPGEPAARLVAADAALLAKRYRIAFVPGLLADCTVKWLVPFSDVAADLRASGFEVSMLRISGRAGTAENAALLATELSALPRDGKRLIVFAYSKGLPDVLDLLIRHPGSRQQISAVVSYAGAANGSPLADELRGVYEAFVSKLPLEGCAAGTGAELEALRPSVRQAWWKAHQAELSATQIAFFSLIGAPLPDQVSPVLRSNHASLAKRDANNDGQLLAADAVVPGSALLGYVNADHWAIAIPLSKHLPALSALFRDDLPRTALVSAAIAVVDQTLSASATHTPQP